MEKFTLINKARSRIKVFEPFEDSSKNSSIIKMILISYDCVLISDQVSQILKTLGLNLSEKRETNIKTIRLKDGKKLIDSIQFFLKEW